jgi:hypothetical protein
MPPQPSRSSQFANERTLPSALQSGSIRHGARSGGPIQTAPRYFLMEGLQRAETPPRSTQKFPRRDVDGGGGGATRPSAALAPSAPAAHRLLMRCSRAARSKSRASARSQRCWGPRPQQPLAARPSAALAPSAPAGTMLAMRLSRAGQCSLARLLALKPWTPCAFRAKSFKSFEAPPNAPSAKFQLILQVFPT